MGQKRPNIKHSTLIGDYAKGGLKDIDILSKFKSLHLFWLKRLFDENYHPWKLIPLHYINIASSNTLLFLPNLDITANRIKDVPVFYQNIIKHWNEISQSPPQTPLMVLSESLWFNSFIKIDNMSISPSFCGVNQSIFMCDLFTDNGNFITWDAASIKLNTLNPFKWIQIMNAIPVGWKNIVQGTHTHITRDSYCLDIHLNKKENIIYIK